MSGIKRLIEDVADDVNNLMHKCQMQYEPALVKVLKERKMIEKDSDEDAIKMWDDNISHMIW